MRHRAFGATGIQVSLYGLGTWAMGGGVYGSADDQESIRTIHLAESYGINFIDTAPMYGIGDRRDGRAETVVGQAIRGRRDRWIVATKFGRHLTGADDWEAMTCDFSARRASESVDESLLRMGIDHIDVLFVHSPFARDFDPHDSFRGMERLREQGKIRVIGFSFLESIADTLPLVQPYMESGLVQAVQVKQSLLTPETNRLLLPLVRACRTAVVAREALGRGFLTDAFTADDEFPDNDWKSELDRHYIHEQLARRDQFRFLVDPQAGIHTLPQAALHWVVSHPEVSTVIPGPRNERELIDCLAACNAPDYDAATMARAESIRQTWSPA